MLNRIRIFTHNQSVQNVQNSSAIINGLPVNGPVDCIDGTSVSVPSERGRSSVTTVNSRNGFNHFLCTLKIFFRFKNNQ